MNKQFLKRKWIFNSFANNLINYLSYYDLKPYVHRDGKYIEADFPFYKCPLCLKTYEEKSITGSSPILTLEHIPPKSLKGSPKILTCKTCNNTFGLSTDKDLLDKIDKGPFLNMLDNSSIKSEFIVDNFKIKGEIKHKSGNDFLFKFNDKSSAYQINYIENHITKPSGKLKISFILPNKFSSNRALLRIAYLEMFVRFGYHFVCDKNSTYLREVINDPNSKTPIHVINDNLTADHAGLNLIIEPKQFQNFLFVIPLSHENRTNYIGVIIPKSGIDGWNKYLAFSQKTDNIPLVFRNYSFFNCLSNTPVSFYYNN